MKKSEELVKFVDFVLGLPRVRKASPYYVHFEAVNSSGEFLFDGWLSLLMEKYAKFEYEQFLRELDEKSSDVKEAIFYLDGPNYKDEPMYLVNFIKKW